MANWKCSETNHRFGRFWVALLLVIGAVSGGDCYGVSDTGSIDISTTPERVQYSVVSKDGAIKKMGKTPEILAGLPFGTYAVTFHLNGWPDQLQMVNINSKTLVLVTWQFPKGKLNFTSTPEGVEISERGNVLGKTPLSVELPAGYHKFTYKCPGCPDQQRDVEVLSNKTSQVVDEFSPDLSTDTTAAKPGEMPVNGHDFENGIGMKLNWVAPLNTWVGVYEVTQRDYQKIMGNNPSEFNGNRLPVETVSWFDAENFCSTLTKLERASGNLPKDKKYDLPTDAQWSVLVADASLDDAVTSLHGDLTQTENVGSKGKNKYGLYDTRGNVWEWCLDWYNNSMNDPALVKKFHMQDFGGKHGKVLRGGGWYNNYPLVLGASYRINYPPDTSFKAFGFRCILTKADN